jgi:hypothetical protein
MTLFFYNKDFIEPVIVIPTIDIILCRLFTKKARWFQLHSIINFIISYYCINDTILLFKSPIKNIVNNKSDVIIYYITLLHLYHLRIKLILSRIEIIHHILFVLLGVLPCIYYWNNNIISLWIISGCGIPGGIDYGLLTLVKHNKISSIRQKNISSVLNNYIRYPLGMYGLTVSFIAFQENIIIANKIFFIYISILIYSNISYFNKLSIENHINSKLLY